MLSAVTLEGRLVALEPLCLDHVDELAAAAAEDRTTYGYTHVPAGREEAVAYVEQAIDARSTGRQLAFAVRRLSTGRIAGSTRFMDLDVFTWPPPFLKSGPAPTDERPPSVAEIGSTWYAASAQRTGVNTECKLLMLEHTFDRWHALRVSLKTDARNERSRAAIERLGAVFEGVRRAHSLAVDGTVRDTAYYSIVSDEWPAVRGRLEGLLARR